MKERKYLKLSFILPIISGIMSGTVLFALGQAEDAPGLCLMGLTAAFFLIMWAIYNAGMITGHQLMFILPLCFGIGGFVLSIVLQLDGEFKEMPYLLYIGLFISITLLFTAFILKRRLYTRKA